MRNAIQSLFVVGLAASLGCSFIARGPDQYRDDTRAVLQERSADIKVCYDRALTTDETAAGNVVVNFTVEKQTGVIKDVALGEGTSASAALGDCVVNALQGLQLTPEDQRDGIATFTYTFRANPAQPAV